MISNVIKCMRQRTELWALWSRHTSCTYICMYIRTSTLCPPLQIPVVVGFGVFVTTTNRESHTTLPSCLQEHFRSFSLTPPPPGLIFRVQAAILGYRQPRLLADRLMVLYNLSKEQL